ncbi:MAG TPA: carboxypeptidase regulatory-like domain-containing protein [Acidobacteriota bacterium]|jgi:outer membrane receptor protein involved in Fe transport
MKTAITVFLIAFFCLAANLPAADVTGTISGVIKDPSGAVVPGVEVVATNKGTNAAYRSVSDDIGVYIIRGIPVGQYDLAAQLAGFKKSEAKDIRVQVNEVGRVDLTLSVGETSETVTVSGGVIHVDTETATLKTVVDQKRIEELPLNGRNPTQLMRLVAGVQADPRADVLSGTTYPGVVPVSVNGGRANTTNYILDGGQNNDHYSNAPNPMPNPDALQEFSVQTNNFSAEFGRNVGGVVNAVTKSGTNSLHGSAFDYLRNHAVNAANYFSPIDARGKKRDDGLKRNQFGGTLGGPVWLGKLYDGRDRTFFFFSYQGTRNRQTPLSVERIVPTEAQRRGDFSALGRPLRNPFTGGVYPNNQIPLSDFNPAAKAILDFLPVPAAGKNTVAFAVLSNLDDDQTMVRGDHKLSGNNQLSARFWLSQANTPAFLDRTNYLAQNTGRTWRNTSVALTDTHTFSASLINTALFGFNRTNNNNFQIMPAKSLTELGIKMYNDKTPQYHLTINGYFQINTGDTNTFLRDEYQVTDTVRWSRGRHQISLGGEYGYGIGDIVNNFRANGQFGWSNAAPFTGDALADFLVGKFATLSQGIGEYKKTRFNMFALFFQDAMRVNRRLTVDLGVRWDPFFPYTDVDGKLSAWRPGKKSERYVNAPVGVLYPGDPGLPDGGYETTWRNLGPRVGFAWDVFGDAKTSVRGGYGIFYDRANTIGTNSQANQGPFGTVVNINGNATNSFTDPYAGTTNPFPGTTNPPRDVVFFLPHTAFVYEEHMRNPYLQAWNLTLEREIKGDTIIRAGYAASKGTALVIGREGNAAVYAPGATTATTNQRRPLFPNFGNVTLIEPTGNSTFHSLQLTAEKRFSRSFSILSNYMLSRSIDDSSANKGTGTSRTNPFNQRYDKGLSDFDHAHVFTTSGLWELPLRPENRFVNAVLGGWNLTSIVTLQSGFPFTVGSGVDNARTGTGGQRADLIGEAKLPDNRSRGEKVAMWLNKNAFAPNALGTFGNQGRNMWRGPGYAAVDLGVQKSFYITEQLRTQFRFETFNAFNRVNLMGPNASQNSGTFMRTSSAFDPRILQFALRVVF